MSTHCGPCKGGIFRFWYFPPIQHESSAGFVSAQNSFSIGHHYHALQTTKWPLMVDVEQHFIVEDYEEMHPGIEVITMNS